MARWDAQDTPLIYKIFIKKCRRILIEGWYNVRTGRTAERPSFASPEAAEWALEFFRTNAEHKRMSEQNKKNCKGTGDNPQGPCRHRGGRIPSYKHKRIMAAKLKRPVLVNDMYKRLKVKADGTYLDMNGAQVEAALEHTVNILRERYDGKPIPEAEDLDMAAAIIGHSRRTGLPKVIGSAATLVKGSRYQSCEPHHYRNSQSATQREELNSEVTSLLAQLSQRLDDMQHLHEQQAQEVAAIARVVTGGSIHSQRNDSEDDHSDEDS